MCAARAPARAAAVRYVGLSHSGRSQSKACPKCTQQDFGRAGAELVTAERGRLVDCDGRMRAGRERVAKPSCHSTRVRHCTHLQSGPQPTFSSTSSRTWTGWSRAGTSIRTWRGTIRAIPGSGTEPYSGPRGVRRPHECQHHEFCRQHEHRQQYRRRRLLLHRQVARAQRKALNPRRSQHVSKSFWHAWAKWKDRAIAAGSRSP